MIGCAWKDGENGCTKVTESGEVSCNEQHSTSDQASIIKQLEEQIQEKETVIEKLTQELCEYATKIESSPNEIMLRELKMATQNLEEILREKENTIEMLKQDEINHSTQCQHLSEKENRIEELEEALRESVRITADREMALDAETREKRTMDEKVQMNKNKNSNKCVDSKCFHVCV